MHVLQQQQQQQQLQQTQVIHHKRREHTSSAIPTSLPIDDFDLLENPNKYGEEERQLRIKLAAVYRLIELNGWSMGIYNHVTVSPHTFHLALFSGSKALNS